MLHLVDFIALALASSLCVTDWFNSELFKNVREKLEARTDKLGELAGCPFCLSHHTTFWLAVLLWLPAQLLPDGWHELPRCVLYILAATTIVHFLQDAPPFSHDEELPDNHATPED